MCGERFTQSGGRYGPDAPLARFPQPLIAKVTVTGALHDRLGARKLDVRPEALGHCEVGTADQQKSKLRLAECLVELRVSTSPDLDVAVIL